ncbi:type II toxin-antitoxin system HipA family toxin [Escherichia coli]|uniref:HipA domain-containing protein n=1 Tax=Escherichia coli TaxID=562 RepID=UPI00163FB0A9|nr:type II toxin-antitoxin system HipA family toxin [Escherichia coli]EFC6632206.1 type II toxin-antitoxin system HipA family toxin [Escherichia coli]EFH3869025.1 type II toxin-antitoxin system HipA family toxin [Escherichia coli]EFN0053694.1 type II toxin-antitoxin system HipA family toxin [Escherichia coli]EGO5839574.1 type II toxin-antitoxin system HipA family toxin [Escherichia coli]
MPKLVTWMNNQRVGELTKLANGAHTFKYAPEWLASRYARPLSLSLPLQRGNITSDAVFNFFDNLLPDSPILPIGEIRQPNATLDLSQSVDNEYYCLLLAKELGLNVPDAEIIKAGNVRALAVERFDRRWNAERTVLLRLPQEDMCQTFGLPSSVKYESDGGPGIARIMAFLMGSSEALKDRYDFMKFQVFQWLIGATDGHAKNFSVFIQAGGSYRLTPFYDIISAFPVLGGAGIHISDLKLAMGLNASKGKKTAIDKIYPRHFLATAKVLKFPQVQMHEILSDFARMIPAALDNVKTSLPTDFPENVVTAVETNVLRLHRRLSREWY